MTAHRAAFGIDWPVCVKRRGWLASDIDRENVSYTLGPEQLAAFRELVSRHTVARTPYTAISREQFRHPALDFFFARMVEALKWGKGLVFLRGLPVDSYSLNEMRLIYWGIGTHFGTALSQKKYSGEVMLDLSSKQEVSRGFSGRHELELHTDYTEIGALLCLQQASAGGINIYASSLMLWDIVEREHPELIPILRRGFRVWRLNEHNPGDDPITRHQVPAFGEARQVRSVYNTWRTAEAVGEYIGQPLSDLEKSAISTVYEILARKELHFRAGLSPGEAVFFSNFDVLHARTAFNDEPNHPRHLLRLWLQGTPARPLPEEMRIHNNGSGRLGYDHNPDRTAEEAVSARDNPVTSFMRDYFDDFFKGRQSRFQ